MQLRKMAKRRWRLSELLTAGVALGLAAGAAVRFVSPASPLPLVAVVMVDGEQRLEIPLSNLEGTVRFSLLEEYGVPVHLQAEEGRIRFVDVDCPDHLCEKSGWLVEPYQSAVCMPNRTVVTVYEAREP